MEVEWFVPLECLQYVEEREIIDPRSLEPLLKLKFRNIVMTYFKSRFSREKRVKSQIILKKFTGQFPTHEK